MRRTRRPGALSMSQRTTTPASPRSRQPDTEPVSCNSQSSIQFTVSVSLYYINSIHFYQFNLWRFVSDIFIVKNMYLIFNISFRRCRIAMKYINLLNLFKLTRQGRWQSVETQEVQSHGLAVLLRLDFEFQ